MSLYSCCSSLRLLVTGCAVAAFIPLQALADIVPTRNVYKGSFIITSNEAGSPNMAVAADTQRFSRRGLKVLKTRNIRGARRQMLVSKLAAAADEVVPYSVEEDICPELINSGEAVSCSPNWEVRISAVPNDTSFNGLWGMLSGNGINATAAWDTSAGSSDVVVAIIDTGVDYTHPDLAQNMWVNQAEVAGNGIDDDHNGLVDDIYGANYSRNGRGKGDPFDDNSHGTHVAGTIGGVGNNARGVAGVNWHVKLMALKFLNAGGSGSLDGAIDAINYMIMMKERGANVRIVNNSWGGGGFSQPLYDAIKAAQDAGIIFVAAAGNESNDNDSRAAYPASYDLENIVSVAAIDQNGNLAGFSNYGANKVDIAAPGVGILSTVPGNGYATYSGTSMAAPHVAGALALLLAADSGLSNADLMSRLYESGVSLASLNGIIRTGRTTNVARMLSGNTEPLPPAEAPPVPCNYSIDEIPFAPNTSVAAEPVVLQADEFSFYQLSLPFMLPFYRGQVGSLHISPNGVIYTKSAPNSMDYKNGSRAPANSIAPLQTDLLADIGSSDGVRVQSATDKVTIFWDAKAYDQQAAGNVKVWVQLYADGTIEQYLAFDSKTVEKAVRSQATIGIAGPIEAMADTYAVNSNEIRSGLALRYTPHCSEDDVGSTASVRRIRINPLGRTLSSSSRVGIRIQGSGYGDVPLTASFNGQQCENSATAYMSDGRASMSARVPRGGVNQVVVSAGGKKAKMRLKKRSAHTRSKRIGSKKLSKLCDSFFGSLK